VTILAIDTCEANCSAALVREGDPVFQASEPLGRGHAERLLPMIESLLAEAALDYSDLRRIAVITGPGTFTGLRIGLSVARGLALALGVPCLGISSLTALAAQAQARGVAGPVHALIAGRGGQVFHQCFESRDGAGLPKSISVAANLDADDAHQQIESRSGYVLGSGVPLVMGRETASADIIDVAVLAGLVKGLAPADFPPEPYYLRAADAVKAKPILQIREITL
jgi:tRNA threonylcarbamoyladenosine biosynthesis protein TsaB